MFNPSSHNFCLVFCFHPELGIGVGNAVGNGTRVDWVGAVIKVGTIVVVIAPVATASPATGNAFNPGASPSSSGKLICASESDMKTNNKYTDRQYTKIDGFITSPILMFYPFRLTLD